MRFRQPFDGPVKNLKKTLLAGYLFISTLIFFNLMACMINFSNRSALDLSIRLHAAIKDARGFGSVNALYPLKNLAVALEAYSASRQIQATYQPPGFFPSQEGQAPLTATIHETFKSALKKHGVFLAIRSLEIAKESAKNPIKMKVLSEVITVGQLAIKFVCQQLEQTPSCLKTKVTEIVDNPSFIKKTKFYTHQTL
jgi:hypothetical protein